MHDRHCPICGWIPPEFLGNFYEVVGNTIKFNMTIEDLIETDLDLENIPNTHYPKIINRHKYGCDEMHLCPICNKEFILK